MRENREEPLRVIIGRESNLSSALSARLERTHLLSAGDILRDAGILEEIPDGRCDIIFNNFQTANRLNDISDPEEYIGRSVYVTSKVLGYFRGRDIGRIIYTGSSSVYGNNILCRESDELRPLNLHAALKVSNEKLIESYCALNGADCTIARVFNMYGGSDNFSVISRIKNAYLKSEKLTIVNNGNAIRDFIHIDDVVDIYLKLLSVSGVERINIGTGRGSSIRNILDFLKNNGIAIETENIERDELSVSTAEISLLNSLFGKKDFIRVEEYLLETIQAESGS